MSLLGAAAKALKSVMPPEQPALPLPPALVERARAQISLQHTRRRRWRIAVGLALAASIAGASVGAWLVLRPRGSVQLRTSVASREGAAVLTPAQGAAVQLEKGMSVEQGAVVTTHAGGHAQLELSTGGELELMESSEVKVEQASVAQRWVVHVGRTRVHVKPLAAGQSFTVATEDAEVIVKGTRFEVEVTQVDAACDVATATRVHVDEGTVRVRHGSNETVVHAGGSWPRCSAAVEDVVPAPALVARPEAEAPVAAPSSAAVRDATLSEQNAQYREAIAARRRGDDRGALALFAAYAKVHPNSPMTEAARVEELRLLRKLDAPAALDAAQRYLADYPRGFARDEAEAIVAP